MTRLELIQQDHDHRHQTMTGVSEGWCWVNGRDRRDRPNTVKCDLGVALTALSRTTRETQAASPSGPSAAPVARCARGSLKGQP